MVDRATIANNGYSDAVSPQYGHVRFGLCGTGQRPPGKPDRTKRVTRTVVACLGLGAVFGPVLMGPEPVGGAAVAHPRAVQAHTVTTSLVWTQTLPDAGSPVAESSPSVATLDGAGPSVVVGDRTGTLWAFHLSDGAAPAGWPAHTGGVPIDSTPSVASVD